MAAAVRVRLEGSPARTALAAAITGLLLVQVFAGGAEFFASRLAQRWDEASLQRAIRLEPDNAAYWGRLGEQQLLQQGRAADAITSLQNAVRLNPQNSALHLTLAAAYRVLGDASAESAALENALEADPTRPQVMWVAANSYLSHGNVARGLQLLCRYLAATDEDPTQALDLAWRVARNAETILDQLPPRPREYLSMLNVLVRRDESAAAAIVWSRIARLHADVPVADVLPYIDYLVLHHDGERAKRTWNELTALKPALRAYRESDNEVTNGGFEQPMLNGGFDWMIYRWPGAQGMIDTSQAHGGTRSLLVEFSGDPVQDAGIHQEVVVEPGARYQVSAFLRADDVQTASGLRMCIRNAARTEDLGQSEGELGTTPWRELTATFTAGPSDHLVQLRFERHPDDSHISGRIWIDDVTMKRISPAEAGRK